MAVELSSRYGGKKIVDTANTADAEAAIRKLIDELRTEEFEEPDDEHTQVSVSRDDWSITVQVSGLVTLDDLSWITGSPEDVPILPRYLRDVPDDPLVSFLLALAHGDTATVLAAEWKPLEQVTPYVRDYYRPV